MYKKRRKRQRETEPRNKKRNGKCFRTRNLLFHASLVRSLIIPFFGGILFVEHCQAFWTHHWVVGVVRGVRHAPGWGGRWPIGREKASWQTEGPFLSQQDWEHELMERVEEVGMERVGGLWGKQAWGRPRWKTETPKGPLKNTSALSNLRVPVYSATVYVFKNNQGIFIKKM